MHEVYYGVDRIDQMLNERFFQREEELKDLPDKKNDIEQQYNKDVDRLQAIKEYLLKRRMR